MKKVFKKISLGNVSDTLSDSQLKKVLGGKKVLGAIYCDCWCHDGDGGEPINVGGLCGGSSVAECETYGCPTAGYYLCIGPTCKEA